MRPLVVAIALVGMLLVPSVPAASEAAADAPHVLVRIVNEGPAVTATLRVAYRDQEPYFERAMEIGAGEVLDVRVDGEPGQNVASLQLPERAIYERNPRYIPGELLEPSGGPLLEAAAWNHDCPGPYAVEFEFSESHWASDILGCTVLTPDFAELLDEARAAKVGFPRASFDIPAPGSADRGVYDRPSIEIPFEWRADVASLDEFGREVRGAEVTYVDPFMSGMGFGGGIIGDMAWASADNTVEVMRYRDGEVRPMSWSITRPVDANIVGPAVQLAREIRYDDARHVASCLLRNVFQGKTVRAGDSFSAEEVCPLWPGADWHAREPIDWGGLRALPLYQVEESNERTHVARILLVDEMPYIAEYERFTLPAGRGVSWWHHTLEKLERAGAPISLTLRGDATTAPALEPVDPLDGPAHMDARFAMSLAEASAAARSDPAVLARRSLAIASMPLAGAAYAEEQDAGSPLARAMWLLTLVDGDQTVYVGCDRVILEAPVPPPIACASPPDWGRYQFGAPILDPPAMGAGDLPIQAPSFDAALARWDAAREEGPSDRASFAVYRSWTTEEGEPPVIAVGLAPPRPMTQLGAQATGVGDHLALGLDGRTSSIVQLTQAASTVDPSSLALVRSSDLAARGPSSLFGEATPYAVGAGLGLAILLALVGFLLYSRLVRSRVLDHETRAQIHDLVEREPGIHSRALLERLGKNSGVGEYHLGVLVREGFLTTVATPGFTRYFIAGKMSPVEMRSQAVLREGQNEKLLTIIRARPGIGVGELAEAAGVSMPYASKGVAKLVDAGLVRTIREGRAVKLHENLAASA